MLTATLLTTSRPEAIGYLRNNAPVLTPLHDDVDSIQSSVIVPALLSICLCNSSKSRCLAVTPPGFSHEGEKRVFQDTVDDTINIVDGVLITRGKQLRGQIMIDSHSAIRIAARVPLSKRDANGSVLEVPRRAC